MPRLLILSCSHRKSREATLLPALRRYDGVSFRTLRKWQRGTSPPSLDILIISAAYGIVLPDDPLPDYDARMTPIRAKELRPVVDQALGVRLARTHYDSIFIDLGTIYRLTIDPLLFRSCPDVAWATGPIGARAAQLKHWLESSGTSSTETSIPPPVNDEAAKGRVVKLRGREWRYSPDEAREKARVGLLLDASGADNYASWHVVIDDRRVAPKWFVRQLTGFAVGTFTTSEARRFLYQLGIPVHSQYLGPPSHVEPS